MIPGVSIEHPLKTLVSLRGCTGSVFIWPTFHIVPAHLLLTVCMLDNSAYILDACRVLIYFLLYFKISFHRY